MKSMIPLALAAIASPAAAAVNLVTNGGFEAPTTTPGGLIMVNSGDSFTGWNVLGSGKNVFLINKTYSEGGGSLVFNSNSGNAWIDLTGAGNQGPTSGISQVVATGTGTYSLSFFVGNATGRPDYTGPSTLNLSINDGPIQIFTNSDVTPNAMNWKAFSVNFFATDATKIAFTNGNIGDNALGLDDVSISAVPEPASWAMLIGGFGLTGAAMRRRRRVTAVLA